MRWIGDFHGDTLRNDERLSLSSTQCWTEDKDNSIAIQNLVYQSNHLLYMLLTLTEVVR